MGVVCGLKQVTRMTDWKEKYLDLSEKQEELVEQSAESEQLLCRAIVRLTIATSGLDPNLDPHLKKLQKAAKGDPSSSEFKQRLTELSDVLVRAGDRSDSSLPPDLFGRLIEGCSNQGKPFEKLTNLHAKLLPDPLRASDSDLDKLIELLMQCRGEEMGGARKKGGMLGKLLGTDKEPEVAPSVPAAPVPEPEQQKPSISPNGVLIDLMRRLNWPAQLNDDIRQLREQLMANAEKDSAWVRVMEEMAGLFANALDSVESDLHDTESFLAALNARLQEIDAVFQRMGVFHEQTMENGRALRKRVGDEVGGVRRDVDEATDLEAFKALVTNRLDAIQDQVEQHLSQEQELIQASSRDTKDMQGRIKTLEEEGQKLRSRLEEVQAQAITDALTGLPNRAAYERRIQEEYARWKRFGKPLTMLVWDIDHFKRINDSFGHSAGDKTLRVIGKTLASKVRETDFVARFGGEEFVMLMPGSDKDQVGRVANQIRESVAEKPFHAGPKRIPITISCGYSQFSQGDEPEDVFKRADDALYEAKQAGRNCCIEGK